MDLLPEDALAGVLGRLAPRDLAASRCVCREWRGVVDARRLLRTDLLPNSVGGIFVVTSSTAFPPLLSCPSPSVPAIWNNVERFGTGDFGFGLLEDHCNGLLLFSAHVVNPATGRWARLPPPPPGTKENYHQQYLMYEPATSPHYEVLLVPAGPNREDLNRATEEAEWPPSSCAMHLFSSRTGHWEERSFQRQGRAMGTVHDFYDTVYYHSNYKGVYWRGALYVQCCRTNFVMRINLSGGNYHVIDPPEPIPQDTWFGLCELHLGKSEKGLYYSIPAFCRLLVWSLDESNGQMQWVLKFDRQVKLSRALAHRSQQERRWFLDCFGEDNYVDLSHYDSYSSDEDVSAGYGSDSGQDIKFVDTPGDDVEILGIHPYKEVLFLRRGGGVTVLAYHLNMSKEEYLGDLCTARPLQRVIATYVYTPCWMGDDGILDKS